MTHRDEYSVHLVSLRNETNKDGYSCIVRGGPVAQWQLDILKDFIAKKEAELAAPPEEVIVEDDYGDLA